MAKELRILDDVVDYDLPNIVAYHLPKSRAKTVAIVLEYDRAIATLEDNPLLYRLRPHGWRACVFRSGTYALYYREFKKYWLKAP